MSVLWFEENLYVLLLSVDTCFSDLLDFGYNSIISSFIPAMHSGSLLYLGTVLGGVESSNTGEQKMHVNMWTSEY